MKPFTRIPLVVGGIAGTLAALGFTAFTLASHVGVAEIPSETWVTSTLPKPSDTKGFSSLDTVIDKTPNMPTKVPEQKPEFLGVSELCVLADRSPSGEGLIFAVFRHPETAITAVEWEKIVEANHRTLIEAIETQPCSERGNAILMETLPYIVEAEG